MADPVEQAQPVGEESPDPSIVEKVILWLRAKKAQAQGITPEQAQQATADALPDAVVPREALAKLRQRQIDLTTTNP